MADTRLHPNLVTIAGKLRETIGPKVLDKRFSLNLFLVGAAGPVVDGKPSLRYRLRKAFEKTQGVEVYYPEDLFGELIWGSKKMDLLRLENLLADSVNAVVVCPESPGSLVELGAFANHRRLCEKMIVVGNKRFSRAHSFVTLGPLRFLSQNSHGAVLWRDYATPNLSPLVADILDHVKVIRRAHPPVLGFGNPVYLERFLLVLISIMQPITTAGLVQVARTVVPEADEELTAAALSYLFHKRAIRLELKEYTVTAAGLGRLERLLSYDNWRLLRRTMDELRVEALDTKYRVEFKSDFVFRGKVART